MLDERLAPVSHPPVRLLHLVRLDLERRLELALEIKQQVQVGEDVVGDVDRDDVELDELLGEFLRVNEIERLD